MSTQSTGEVRPNSAHVATRGATYTQTTPDYTHALNALQAANIIDLQAVKDAKNHKQELAETYQAFADIADGVLWAVTVSQNQDITPPEKVVSLLDSLIIITANFKKACLNAQATTNELKGVA